ncbi:MAG TPA: TonB-dependent receptor [Longimicrobiales bacterium]|nr:TonB-dependent receptor [Longimicrobiales bacterium]
MRITSRPETRRLRGAALSLLVALLAAGPVAAQDNGRVTGQVTGRSGAPIPGVQVYISATNQGTLTNESGRFLITNVAAGTHTVRAERIGFQGVDQQVTVEAGASVVVSFTLMEQALGLDEIVVTGTAGAARRREVGNTVAQINVTELPAPPANVDALLQSQAAGILVGQGNGAVGSGAQIRLRGAVSVSQSNQPIIYVDGVRIRSDAYSRNISPTEGAGRGGNVTASPLNDINPADIERIEVLKGSAASTLYGTEAAAGVIQIFTKRGRAGAAQWSMQVDQGFNRLMPFAPDVDVRPPGDPTFADIPQGQYSYERLNMEPYLRDGHRQKYALSVSGGGQALQYYMSGQYDQNEGVLPLDEEKKSAIRGNFTFSPLSMLTVQVNSGYTRTDISNTPAGNNAQGLILNAYRRERNYFSNGDPDTVRLVLNQETTTRVDRFILGGTLNFHPMDQWTNRFTIGYDEAVQDNRSLRPYGYRQLPTGKLYTSHNTYTALTADFASNYQLGIREGLSTTLSVGGQSVTTEDRRVQAEATNFAGPGDPDIDAGANRLSWETRERVVNAGFFGQALFNLLDRYFLTVGVRVDGNSAFGEDLGLQTYPKISGSYIISDESFWSPSLGVLKLRAAWGQSGRAPGTFDAVRTWDAVGYGGDPAYTPANLGNADLGPERTSETEVGFDWAVLDNRVSTEVTWYRQRTTDALFNVRKPPSEGFALTQLENVGTIQNQGWELNVNAALLDRQNWGFDIGANLYTNKSEVIDLGAAVPFAAGGGWVEEGLPVMVLRGVKIHNGDRLEDPVRCTQAILDAGSACYELDVPLGPQQPTLTFGIAPTLRMPRGITLSARAEYMGGHWIYDGPTNEAVNRGIRWPTCLDYYQLTDAGNGDQATAERRYFCDGRFYVRGTMAWKADFAKIRDVTLQVPLGTLIPRTSSSMLTLSAQNFYRWRNDDFPIFDPEMVSNAGFGEQNPSITEHIPPAASFVASIRVNF